MIYLDKHRKLLLLLVEKEELPINEITELLCTTKRDVPRMINKLAEEGYIISTRREGYFKGFYLSKNTTYRIETILTDTEIKALVSSQAGIRTPSLRHAVSKIVGSAQPKAESRT